jgi:Icc-related predicted phosphoesterase
MLISSIADLDPLGMDLEPFWDIVRVAKEPDMFLLAGDIYEFRNPEVYSLVLDFIKLRKWKCPIVAVFGNREFEEDTDDIKKICKGRITFLDDESLRLKIKGKSVGIVGSRGALDDPTWWQSTHVPGIRDGFTKRVKKCEGLLSELDTDIKIFLSHYSPTYKTLVGEDRRVFRVLGSRKLEEVLVRTKTTFAVHGHAHYGIPLAFVDSIPIFNVALMVNRKIVEIDTDKLPKPGLHKFV